MFGVKWKCVGVGKWCAVLVLQIVFFVALCKVGHALKIKHLYVPDNANIKSTDPIKLECILQYEENDNITSQQLVAKWYLNDTLLFQWSNTRSLPYVNKTFTNRVDWSAINRTQINSNKMINVPLVITKKDIDLTGRYRCQAETYTAQEYEESYMVMYVPVDNMTLDQVFDNVTNELNVTCGAEDVYPKPEITLTINDEKNITGLVLDVRMNENQLFDITANYVLPVNTLKAVTTINCSIALPGVDHISSRLIHYSKSGADDGDSDDKVAVMLAENTGSTGCSFNELNSILISLSVLSTLIMNRI